MRLWKIGTDVKVRSYSENLCSVRQKSQNNSLIKIFMNRLLLSVRSPCDMIELFIFFKKREWIERNADIKIEHWIGFYFKDSIVKIILFSE